MKRFLSAVGLCVFLLILGFFVILPTSQAENNILLNLLSLPAPPPPNPSMQSRDRRRPENFFNKSKPPGDDAPLEDFTAYWAFQNQFDVKYTYAAKPSEEALKRLISEIEKNPEKLPQFINLLPETAESAEFVKRLYDQELANRSIGRDWRDSIKKWLTYHSTYFTGELVKASQQVGDADDYVTNQNELLALARIDWEKARPILERLLNDANQPVSQTLARWAFYEHALREENSSDIEKYRKQLQETVENRSQGVGTRDLAMDALVESGDFEGRDDWYYSLLSDETLYELRAGSRTFTGLTTLLNHSPPEKYIEKMIELVKSDNQTVRNAAARNLSTLLDQKNPEIIKALLPWLENPKWAKEVGGERRSLVDVLDSVTLPESVPGLIAVLNEKETREVNVSLSSNVQVYSANVPGGVTTRQIETYPFRYAAINALAVQKDARAIPALRLLLPQVEDYERRYVVRALLFSKGFSISEQVEALEFVAKAGNQIIDATQNVSNAAVNAIVPGSGISSERVGNIAVGANITSYVPSDQTSIKAILGIQLTEAHEPDADLIPALLERIEYLDKKDPSTAAALRRIIQNWRGAAVNSMLLRDLKLNKIETDGIVKLLSLRKELKEKQFNEVYDIRTGSSTALGISACLTEDYNDYDAILTSENVESKIAMLGCARLIRASLPVREVARNMDSPNKLLALAAERYLESEDSPEARTLILARHPNEAKILGAKAAFYPETAAVESAFLRDLFISVDEWFASMPPYYYSADSDDFTATEKKLKKEVGENQELLGIYAYDNNFIRIYKDKAVFSWEEDVSRYRERNLTKAEFDAFKSYLAANRVDELPPFLSLCEGCDAKELIMLGRGGGRRVFVRADEKPKFFVELEKMFEEMRQPPAKLHYWLEKSIAGLEILFEDPNLQARAVWKNGDDFRVLIDNEARRKQIDEELEKQEETEAESENYDYEKAEETNLVRREKRQYENFSWYRLESARLASVIAQPAGMEVIPAPDNFPGSADDRRWKSRAANFEIRADAEGLYKIAGGRAVKIRSGYYAKPLVTANGRWVIVTKYGDEEPPALVRVNLTTGKELKIKIEEQQPTFEAVAFIPPLNKVLAFGGTYNGDTEYSDTETKDKRLGEYFLLDVETGAVQAVKSEIRPLAQQSFRPLQPTSKPDEFWAAIPDGEKNETEFGIYNTKTLAFKSLLKLPQISFDSMDMWVDEKESKIYFVYEGHLLSLTLPKATS